VSGTQTISTLTANGSNGTPGGSAQIPVVQGGAGGTASGGDINITGQNGGSVIGSVADPTYNYITTSIGQGGSNFFSKGADGGYPNGNPGTPGGLIIHWFGDA